MSAVMLIWMMVSLNASFMLVGALPNDIHRGPFVEKVVFRIIDSQSQQVEALLDGRVDIIGNNLESVFEQGLSDNDDINVKQVFLGRLDYLVINCQKYPYNITAFRRAVALAMDKRRVCEEAWDGFAIPHDSVIPYTNSWSIENQTDDSYYEGERQKAQTLLDEAGFLDIDDDGFREAPDGTELEISIEREFSMQDTDPGDLIAQDLQRVGLDAHAYGPYYYPNPPRSLEYMDYDMAWLRQPESGVEPSWWAGHLHSSRIGPRPGNWPRFNNTDIDVLADTIVNSSNPYDALSACLEMQSILLEECPVIPCYMPSKLQAYRGDRLAEITGSQGEGIIGWWSSYKGRFTEAAGGPLGGTMTWAIPSGLETFNIMKGTNEAEKFILSHMYESLYRLGPSGEMIPWIVESLNVTTHQDLASVPEGHVRFTLDILENATWSDGESITADDVSFTLQQFMTQETASYWGELSNLFSTFSLTNRRVAVEFNTTSYFHLADFAFIPILPSHVFQDTSPQDWSDWDPDPTSMVTSGPFNVSLVEEHDRIVMEKRPDYFYWHGIETETGNLGISPFQLAIAASLIATGIAVFEVLRRRMK